MPNRNNVTRDVHLGLEAVSMLVDAGRSPLLFGAHIYACFRWIAAVFELNAYPEECMPLQERAAALMSSADHAMALPRGLPQGSVDSSEPPIAEQGRRKEVEKFIGILEAGMLRRLLGAGKLKLCKRLRVWVLCRGLELRPGVGATLVAQAHAMLDVWRSSHILLAWRNLIPQSPLIQRRTHWAIKRWSAKFAATTRLHRAAKMAGLHRSLRLLRVCLVEWRERSHVRAKRRKALKLAKMHRSNLLMSNAWLALREVRATVLSERKADDFARSHWRRTKLARPYSGTRERRLHLHRRSVSATCGRPRDQSRFSNTQSEHCYWNSTVRGGSIGHVHMIRAIHQWRSVARDPHLRHLRAESRIAKSRARIFQRDLRCAQVRRALADWSVRAHLARRALCANDLKRIKQKKIVFAMLVATVETHRLRRHHFRMLEDLSRATALERLRKRVKRRRVKCHAYTRAIATYDRRALYRFKRSVTVRRSCRKIATTLRGFCLRCSVVRWQRGICRLIKRQRIKRKILKVALLAMRLQRQSSWKNWREFILWRRELRDRKAAVFSPAVVQFISRYAKRIALRRWYTAVCRVQALILLARMFVSVNAFCRLSKTCTTCVPQRRCKLRVVMRRWADIARSLGIMVASLWNAIKIAMRWNRRRALKAALSAMLQLGEDRCRRSRNRTPVCVDHSGILHHQQRRVLKVFYRFVQKRRSLRRGLRRWRKYLSVRLASLSGHRSAVAFVQGRALRAWTRTVAAGKLKLKNATLRAWRCLVTRSRNDRMRRSFARWCIFYKSRKAFLRLFAKALWHSYLRFLMRQWRRECILRHRRHRIGEAIYERLLSLARITFSRWRVHARLECVSFESHGILLYNSAKLLQASRKALPIGSRHQSGVFIFVLDVSKLVSLYATGIESRRSPLIARRVLHAWHRVTQRAPASGMMSKDLNGTEAEVRRRQLRERAILHGWTSGTVVPKTPTSASAALSGDTVGIDSTTSYMNRITPLRLRLDTGTSPRPTATPTGFRSGLASASWRARLGRW